MIQELPLHPRSGWILKGMHDGVRVFTRHFDSLEVSDNVTSEKEVLASSLVLDITLHVRYFVHVYSYYYTSVLCAACISTGHFSERVAILASRPTSIWDTVGSETF